GSDEMIHVKEEARALLDDFSLAKLSKMNSDFTARNISPGGCADMLSLTIFISSLINDNSI
ncbi:MAG: triphosphoribosyl-dephospho-CoA synthase, partial [Muribaculaceae bacterium]|nr:triphosphoribosyl-dephospho-CoA synthase [Muribaculaceae bacterium]